MERIYLHIRFLACFSMLCLIKPYSNISQLTCKEKYIEVLGVYKKIRNSQSMETYLFPDFFFSENNYYLNRQKSNKFKKQQIEDEIIQTKFNNKSLKSSVLINHSILVTIFLIYCFALILLYFSWKREIKNHKQLISENKLLKEHLIQLKVVTKKTKRLQLFEEEINKRSSTAIHEMQIPLNLIQNTIKEISYKKNFKAHNNLAKLNVITKKSNELSSVFNQFPLSFDTNQEIVSNNYFLFSISNLIYTLLPDYQFLGKKENISIYTYKLPSSVFVIYSDAHKLAIILKNILDNSIQYAQNKGSITVSYSICTKGHHYIKIKDNRTKIAQKKIRDIFQNYFKSKNHNHEIGLEKGLAICREYITSLNGIISVENLSGNGNTFIIYLPKHRQKVIPKNFHKYSFWQKELLSPAPEHKTNERSKHITLLVIENDLDYCKYLEKLLQKEYHLIFVHNGRDAMNCLEEKTPDLIIMTNMLPDFLGICIIKHLKSTENFNSIPIILLVSNVSFLDKTHFLNVGMDDYLLKPVDKKILYRQIDRLLIWDRGKNSKTEKKVLTIVNQKWLANIQASILPNLQKGKLSVRQIQRITNISSSHFNRKIKLLTGFTTMKYLQELRFWNVRRLLATREFNSIEDAFLSIGINDIPIFSQKFTERYGIDPIEYFSTVHKKLRRENKKVL